MKKKLLIVDPSDKMVELIYNSIKSMEEIEVIGYCECIEDALNTIKTEKPDIVTTEIEFNDKVDYEILKYIKENDLNIKTMVITKNTDPSIKEKLKEFDVSEYLEKPFQPDFISKRLFSILEDLGLFTVDKNENLVFVRKYPMERVVLEAEIKNNELPLSLMRNRERAPTHKKELLSEKTIRNRKIKKKRIDRENFQNIDDVLAEREKQESSTPQNHSLPHSKAPHNEEDLEEDRENVLNGEHPEETRDSYAPNTIKSDIIQQEDEEYYEEDAEDEDNEISWGNEDPWEEEPWDDDDEPWDNDEEPWDDDDEPWSDRESEDFEEGYEEESGFLVFDLGEEQEQHEEAENDLQQKETYADSPTPGETLENSINSPENSGNVENHENVGVLNEEPEKAGSFIENKEPEEELVFVIENPKEKKEEEISESKIPEMLEDMKKKKVNESILRTKNESSTFGGIPNIINQNLGELEKEIFDKPKTIHPKKDPKESIKVSIAPPRNFESTVEVKQPTIRISEMEEPVLEENARKKEVKKEKSFGDKLIKSSEKLNSFLGRVFKK